MLTELQEKNKQFNLRQGEVGSPLKTLSGSIVRRSHKGVGKLIGGRIYFHKNYIEDVFGEEGTTLVGAVDVPFKYNVIRWDLQSVFSFIECPNFDTAREPVVGQVYVTDWSGANGTYTANTSHFYNQIYHHKWEFVKNDYAGFDVKESWEWSKQWLSILTEPADGSSLINWNKQLERFHLI